MRHLLVLVLSLLCFAPDLRAQEGGGGGGGDRRRGGGWGRRRDRDPSTVVLTNVTYKRMSYETDDLTAKTAYYGVYLPPGYDDPANAQKKYPLVVWLHGMSEDDRDFHFNGAKVLDEQVGAGKLPSLVFVAAAAPSRTLYANGESEGNVRDLITKDLLADVQKNFRVSEKRSERAIMGVSLGGNAALRIAFSQPSLFGTVAVHSAAVFPEDLAQLPEQHAGTYARFGDRLGWYSVLGNPIDPEKFKAFNPTSLAHALPELPEAKSLRIYFDAGTSDRYGFGPANQHLDEVLTQAKVPHTFRLIEGGEHSWGGGTVQQALVESLAFVGEGFGGAPKSSDASPGGAKPEGVKSGEAKGEAKKE
jgi:S-formylglutathione hydrolase FrmB